MKSWVGSILFSVFCICVFQVDAYEIDTHAAITRDTYARTVLATEFLAENLGLDKNTQDFGNTYYDVFGTTVWARLTYYSREGRIIKNWEKTPSPSKAGSCAARFGKTTSAGGVYRHIATALT